MQRLMALIFIAMGQSHVFGDRKIAIHGLMRQGNTFLWFAGPRGSAKMLGAAGATVAAGYAATVTWPQIGWSIGLSATGRGCTLW